MKNLTLNITVAGINMQFDFKAPNQMKVKDLIKLCVDIIEENQDISIATPKEGLKLISPTKQCVLAPDKTVIQNGLSNNDRLILL